MRLPFLLLALPLCALTAAPQALVVEANWSRFNQSTGLRYTHLGTQTRLEMVPAKPADPYLLVDTAQAQRITVYRHNTSWRLDPLEPKPRTDSPAGSPGRPALPQPPPGIGPQGQIGPRTSPGGAAALSPTPGYGPTASQGLAIPQSASRDPQSPTPGAIGPRTGPGVAAANQPAAPAMPVMPEMPDLPQSPTGFGPQNGMKPSTGSMPVLPGAVMGMPLPSALGGREPAPTLTKTEETQPLLGRTAVKYTIAGHMLETVEIWAVPDADLGTFFTYRPQPPHRFGPIDLQEQWDSLLRHEQLFPLLAVFKQGDREIARFTVTKIETLELAEPAAFFAPPQKFYRCPPDPF